MEAKKEKGIFSDSTSQLCETHSQGEKKSQFSELLYSHLSRVVAKRLNSYKIERIGCTRKAAKSK